MYDIALITIWLKKNAVKLNRTNLNNRNIFGKNNLFVKLTWEFNEEITKLLLYIINITRTLLYIMHLPYCLFRNWVDC